MATAMDENIRIETNGVPVYAEMPDHTRDMMSDAIVKSIRRLFEDPKVRKEYEKWKRDKAAREARA